jgi:hypothetical protein
MGKVHLQKEAKKYFLGSPFLHREGGQGVRFLALALLTRLFPFPHGKGLVVRLPRTAKNSMVSPHA